MKVNSKNAKTLLLAERWSQEIELIFIFPVAFAGQDTVAGTCRLYRGVTKMKPHFGI